MEKLPPTGNQITNCAVNGDDFDRHDSLIHGTQNCQNK